MASPAWLSASSKPVFDHASVVKINGWTYNDVSVSLSDDSAFLNIIRNDGASLEIPLSEITTITNSDGEDISLLVAPEYNFQQTPDPHPGRSRQIFDEFGSEGEPLPEENLGFYDQPNPPRLFSYMLAGGLGYGGVEGDFYYGLDSGQLYWAAFRVRTAPGKYVKLGFSSQKAYDTLIPIYDDNGDFYGEVRLTADIQQYSVQAGVLSSPSPDHTLRFYFEGGFSLANHVAKAEGYSESEGRVVLLLDGGIFIPFGSGIGLDAGISLASKLFGGNENEGTGFVYSAKVGLMVPLGSTH